MWGCELLSKGIRLRIGYGDSNVIYSDPWLPVFRSGFGVRSACVLDGEAKASALILQNGTWNTMLIG